jgi:hypothetical protein
MKPRTAGLVGIVTAIIITVLSGVLLARPPFSILGALGLVGGMILLVSATSWTVRSSWDSAGWPVYAEPSVQKSQRFLWGLAIAQMVFVALNVGAGTSQLAVGDGDGWVTIGFSGLFVVQVVAILYILLKKPPAADESGRAR